MYPQNPEFQYIPTEHFTAQLDRIKKSDPAGHRRILGVIERLLLQPSDADGRMRGLYHGRLKKYVGRSHYRIIYHWCLECRGENRKRETMCPECDSLENNSVVFFDIYHKNEKNKVSKRKEYN